MTLQPNLSPAVSKYGAQMGRPSQNPDNAREEAARLRDRGYSLDGLIDAESRETRRQCFAEAYRLQTLADTGALDPVNVSLQHIRLNNGGYDSGGAYWGLGQPLYWAGSDNGAVDLWFRASDRAAAKAHVLASFPNASFYR